jgi:HEAT repeat protein
MSPRSSAPLSAQVMPMPPLACLLLVLVRAAVPAAPPAAVGEDEKLLREAKTRTDGPALLEFFRRRTLTAEQRRQVQALIPRLGDDDFDRRQQASAALTALGPAVAAHIRRALDNSDEEIKERLRLALAALAKESRPAHAAAAARLIRARAPVGAVGVLLAYVPDAADEAVEDEVLLTLAVLGVVEGRVAPSLVEAIKDPEPARRAAAALVVGRSGSAEQRAAVRGLLTDPSPAVRFRAAQGLLATRDRAALSALAALAGDAATDVALRADELLAAVAGAHAPYQLPGAEAAGRAACRAAWESWVRRLGTADLARAEVDLPPANVSLRTAAACRQFALALQRGDGEAVKECTDTPFLVNGENLIEARADLERILSQLAQALREPNAPVARAAVRFVGGIPRTVTPAERAFLGRFRKGELQSVALLWRPAERGPMQSVGLMLLVRVSGPRPRVVGLTVRQ